MTTRVTDGQEIRNFRQGLYQYVVSISAGTVDISISDDDGATFQAMTDGSFSASGDGVIYLNQRYVYKVALNGKRRQVGPELNQDKKREPL